ncbi:MAG: hypothetical protein ANABAC_2545 [Anaerolineae bacterium]|jgi:uncharacterized protein (TIGR04222 family)|nr:MAG: hypothetical protein ANABAC_2545 [Anaerolineae bacterium]
MLRKVLSTPLILTLLAFLMLLIFPGLATAKSLPDVRFHDYLETNPFQPALQGQQTSSKTEISADSARLQGGIAAAISSLLTITFLLRKRLFYQRQVDGAAQALKTSTLPPQALSPGLAAHLCGSSNAALATLFDLTQRGFLRIEEKDRQWGQRVFEIVRQPIKETLQHHEEAFIDALFQFHKTDRVPLSRVAKLVYSKTYQKALDEELILRGWHSPERMDKREQFAFQSGTIMTIGLLLFAMGIGIGWRYFPGALLLGSGGGFLLAGFVGLILSLSIPTLTNEGRHQAAQWHAFATYLKEVAQDDKQPLNPVLFDRYLPLAAGFGFLDQWVSHFFNQPEVQLPDWFSNICSAGQDSVKDAFAAMILSLKTTDVSYIPVSLEGGGSETILSGIP